MPDDEALFLDALYLGVRDVTSFDRALNLLCRLFDVQSATLLDFDAARPEVSHHASVGVLSGEILRRYERDFAALDPAPAAFIKQPGGNRDSDVSSAAGGDQATGRVFRRVLPASRIGGMSRGHLGDDQWALRLGWAAKSTGA
jgi:hypothetical protein